MIELRVAYKAIFKNFSLGHRILYYPNC